MSAIPAHQAFEPADPSLFRPEANLFRGAEATAPRHWSDRAPSFATDGRHDNPGDHWAGENIPVWLTVDLKEPRDLNAIRMWTFWDGRRAYQYVVEGSLDGEAWTVLADNRANTAPQTEAGETFTFPTARARYIRTTFTNNSVSNQAGGHIVEIEGYLLPAEAAAQLSGCEAQWRKVGPGLHAGFASTDTRYARDVPPEDAGSRARSLVAWRGERVHTQALLWTAAGARQARLRIEPLEGENGARIPAACVRASFVRYVLADGRIVPDVVDPVARLDLPGRSVRPVWVSVDVPPDTRPGRYRGAVTVLAEGMPAVPLGLQVEVLPARLPEPAKWSFRLDLWQNPYAIARYHHVEPWSEEHCRILEPHLRLLASAGQKCITTTLVYRPWGTQTYDPYDSMVEWIRSADGKWRYDYTHFDRYVELCMRCGITDSINCYSMVPWGGFRYVDEATGDTAWVHAGPGTPAYEAHWRPFLADFVKHLRERGWLGRTAIAMDEQPLERMRPMLAFLKSAAPELKVALAGSKEPELKGSIDDWCVFIAPPLDPAIARERAGRGLPTTFYVCCGPGRPNTFTFSPPAESAWLGWYAAAQGYGGLLRWAFDSWVEEPLLDTSYVTWPAGDCFLTYPGARTSIRFERLREGIQDFEKVRLVRQGLRGRTDAPARAALKALDVALARFTYERVQKEPAADVVNPAREALDAAARLLAE